MPVLDGNRITADGTYTVATLPGKTYSFAASGDFGGGTLAVKWLDDEGNATAFPNVTLSAAGAFPFTAPSKTVALVVADATDPDIEVSVVVASAGVVTAGAITAALQGTAADPERIGAEYLPAPLERTAAQGIPTIPDILTITGITTPGIGDGLVLARGDDFEGLPSWGDVSSWFLYAETLSNWALENAAYFASKALVSNNPIGLTGWQIDTGVGQPIITGEQVTPEFLGQKCIVTHTDGSKTEWTAVSVSPPQWLPSTPGILQNRDTGLWERTFIEDSIIQTEIIQNQ